jgi:ABC-type branched-subunit amino acid transport system substrate-binding protein
MMKSKLTLAVPIAHQLLFARSGTAGLLVAALLMPAFVMTTGCATKPTAPAKPAIVQAPPAAKSELHQAVTSLRQGDRKALLRLRKIAAQNPESDVADDSNLLMGEYFYNAQKYQDALASFAKVIAAGHQTTTEYRARLYTARTYVRLAKPDDAARELDVLLKAYDLNIDLARIQFDVADAQARHVDAVTALANVVAFTGAPAAQAGAAQTSANQGSSATPPGPAPTAASTEAQRKLRAELQDYIETRLTEAELNTLLGRSSDAFVKAVASYRLALFAADQRQYARAKELLHQTSALVPQTELAARAEQFAQQMDASSRVDANVVGVALPMSGAQAHIGQKALRAIQLGLGIFGKNPSRLRLALVDTQSTAEGARRAIERLVQEDSAIAIIGGLLSKTAEVEAQRAQEFGVPIVVLTQKSGVTAIGENVFRCALTSQMQIHELVETAMGKLGYKSFAMMYPNDAYGVEYANQFWDEVLSRGGRLAAVQPYETKETDFRGHVQRLAGLFYPDDRAEEYRERLKVWQTENPKRSARQAPPGFEDLVPPIVDFDALFIPDGARAVGQIAPMLAYNGIKNVRLLGTDLWNSPSLVIRGQKFVDKALFVDSAAGADPKFQRSSFYISFKELFGDEPGLTEIQSYDAAHIVRTLIASGESTRLGVARRLAQLHDVDGAVGPLSMSPDHEVARSVAMFTVRDSKIVPLAADASDGKAADQSTDSANGASAGHANDSQ